MVSFRGLATDPRAPSTSSATWRGGAEPASGSPSSTEWARQGWPWDRRARGLTPASWLLCGPGDGADATPHMTHGPESEQTPGDSEGQGSLACCSLWHHRESDLTERLDTTTTTWLKVSVWPVLEAEASESDSACFKGLEADFLMSPRLPLGPRL